MSEENQEIEQLLSAHDIKPTAIRTLVARALACAGRPESLGELENQLQSVDKSGIARALALFRTHQLVHIIEDGSDAVRYELCHSHHSNYDDDAHAHFYCTQCHKTYCLEETTPPNIDLPSGFVAETVNFVIKGICPNCHQ